MRDLNLNHKVWVEIIASRTLIEKSEELIMIIYRWEIEQMVFIEITTYKKSISKSIIDLIFATTLLSKSLITCDIKKKSDFYLDH